MIEEGNERGRDGAEREGREAASGGGRELGREGAMEEGGIFHGRYSEEDTGQYTVYSRPLYSIQYL